MKSINFDRKTLAERVEEHLEQEILANRLRPGQPLVEAEVAAALGVSRAPVREAFRALESRGLVRIVPRRGVFVAELSLAELEEIYQVREALERLAMRLAVPRLTEADKRDLKEALDHMERALQAGRSTDYFRGNLRFHEVFVRAAGNRELAELISRVNAKTYRYRLNSLGVNGRLKASLAEHRAILQAALAGDVAEAERRLAEHIEAAAATLGESLREEERA